MNELNKKKWVRISGGIGLIGIGILGILLPLAPGIPFILLGIYLFNPMWFKKQMHAIKKRWKG